jgi:hypothetical protein
MIFPVRLYIPKTKIIQLGGSERCWQVDFLVKYDRTENVDGWCLPETSGQPPLLSGTVIPLIDVLLDGNTVVIDRPLIAEKIVIQFAGFGAIGKSVSMLKHSAAASACPQYYWPMSRVWARVW